jgi:hypothetical protein
LLIGFFSNHCTLLSKTCRNVKRIMSFRMERCITMELGMEGILNLKFLSNCHTQIQFELSAALHYQWRSIILFFSYVFI